MNTAEQIRRQQLAGYYRLLQQQEMLTIAFFIPLVKLVGEKIRELYPERYDS